MPRHQGTFVQFLAAIAVLAIIGCGGSNEGPNNQTSFKGTLVGEGGSGVLTLTIQEALATRTTSPLRFAFVRVAEAATAPVTVTGTLALTGGSTIQLTGTYDAAADPQLVLAGSGYGLAGNYTAANGQISGTSTFPDGKTGLWTVSINATAVSVFCGTYTSSQGNGGGTWNLVLDENHHLSGVATGAGQLQGTLNQTSNAVSVTYTGGTASGTLNPSTGGGNGSYDAPGVGSGDAGTWTATTGGC